MARTVLVAVKDMLFGSKIDSSAKRVGLEIQWSPRFEKLSEVAQARKPDTIIAALDEAGTLDELKIVKESLPEVRLIGFAGHVMTDLLAQARELGMDEVFTKGQFAVILDKVLTKELEG